MQYRGGFIITQWSHNLETTGLIEGLHCLTSGCCEFSYPLPATANGIGVWGNAEQYGHQGTEAAERPRRMTATYRSV